MKDHSKPVMRREFLTTGLVGATLLAILPVKKLFLFSNAWIRSSANQSHMSNKKLEEIIRKYGSEFGNIFPENQLFFKL